ncbi:hypothetical protein TSUD_390770 [Trifolium subterraneum]|uniref:RNase H type-1 domain-containing protein n=1 Tax=Trifolium subterraneum TaxID=3900 RepID=A0A2Z6M0W1_TRISU|nr:hypothetical protein TSUD_390770 [Trifolium subterraneum]
MPWVNSLGRYLGANLASGRNSRRHFSHIVNKIQSKLSGWKQQCLSFAGRITLSKYVISTIPYYHMQYGKIPKTICDEVDKIQRGFLWGDSEQGRKAHLISWDVCCLPKIDGGLGLRKTHNMNEAFLMKILWNLINNPNNLWCRVLHSKYGRNKDLIASISMQPYDSPLWKALAGALINICNQIYTDTTLTVRDVLNSSGNWDLDYLINNLLANTVSQILALPTPMDEDGPDTIGLRETGRVFVNGMDHIAFKPSFGWLRMGASLLIFGEVDEVVESLLLARVAEMKMKLSFMCFVTAFTQLRDWFFSNINRKVTGTSISRWQTTFMTTCCDGASKNGGEVAGCGGLFRDSDGRWIKGYTKKIGTCDALHVEMWGLYLGLDMAWREHFSHLIVESDSKILIDMISDNFKFNGNIPILVQRIMKLLKMNWHVRINHNWREGNRSADWLATSSTTVDHLNLVILETAPSELQQILFDDISRACMLRNVRLMM